MSTPDVPSIGELLRAHREHRGMTQGQLADASGLATITISTIERGATVMPYPKTLLRLAKALDIDVTEFFDPTNSGTTPSRATTRADHAPGAQPDLDASSEDPRRRLLARFQTLSPDQQVEAIQQVTKLVRRPRRSAPRGPRTPL
ncbi:MAG: helix-turn-helix transcriptional regulator [Chloroflexia bacterium]|nr:helix-turn-helix transcriptional regulator [Chloroflexia bacterium]